jgi:toxin ParE1/3/4
MAATKSLLVHPLAWEEINAADQWYFRRSPEASDTFIVEITQAVERISQTPRLWPIYLHGTRRCILHRFPFSVVYLDDEDAIHIVAVAHHKRRPGYWGQRI